MIFFWFLEHFSSWRFLSNPNKRLVSSFFFFFVKLKILSCRVTRAMAHSNAPPIACWVKSRWQVQYSHVILRRARRRTWSRSRSKINVQRDRECSTRVLFMTHRLWSRLEVESFGSDPNLCPRPDKILQARRGSVRT